MRERQWPASELRTDLLLKLPRELRDQIFADAVHVSGSIELTDPLLQHIPPVLRYNSNILTEASQAFYRVNCFVLSLDDDSRDVLAASTTMYAQPKDHIRRLVIKCTECAEPFTSPNRYEKTKRSCNARIRWQKLFEIPRLQNLTICMNKRSNDSLNTCDFGPILYTLRERIPALQITFHITYDLILREQWDNPIWIDIPGGPDTYQPMDYVDVSDLIAPPTEEDFVYVQEYLKDYWEDKMMPPGRNIVAGLLDESPVNRRALAREYAVKEPALLRCLMAEHYKLYQKTQKKDNKKDMDS